MVRLRGCKRAAQIDMPDRLKLRESTASDVSAIVELYDAAIPGEDLKPLLRDLLAGRSDVLSLVWTDDGTVVGHAAFSVCGIEGRQRQVALLGPLAVLPERQRKGLGAALVRGGLNRLERGGISSVFVLGDPAYYGALGFKTERNVVPPYPLSAEWREAWQSIDLWECELSCRGQLIVPEPWRRQALWMP